ncbi:MAG: tetratricopeptide repeat protein, partial [Planctomycetales bacterium]
SRQGENPSAEACVELGQMCAAANEHAAAEKYLRQAVGKSPATFGELCAHLAETGRINDSLRTCIQHATQDNQEQAASLLAWILRRPGVSSEDRELAEPMLAKALKAQPKSSRLCYEIGTLRYFQNRPRDAESLLRRAVELDPNHAPSVNNLALVLAETGKSESEALRLISEAVDRWGRRPRLLDTLGMVLLYQNRSAEALETFHEAASSSAEDPATRFHLALALASLGRVEESQDQLRIAYARGLVVGRLPAAEQRLHAKWLSERQVRSTDVPFSTVNR